jgi:hypothetical protein
MKSKASQLSANIGIFQMLRTKLFGRWLEKARKQRGCGPSVRMLVIKDNALEEQRLQGSPHLPRVAVWVSVAI